MVGGLTAAFFSFVIILISMWVLSSLNRLERNIDNKTAKLQILIDNQAQFEEAKTKMKISETRIRQGSKIQLSATLENLAEQLGINIQDMAPKNPAIDPDSRVIENKVEVNVPMITIDRLVVFLEQLESRSETIKIRRLQMKNNFKDNSLLDVKFTISNFQIKEEKPGADEDAPNGDK
jgi:hypothetical protein